VQLISKLKSRDFYYWRTHTGTELDLFVLKGGKRLGFEIKLSETPKTSRSMLSAFDDLQLDRMYLIYKGHRELWLNENILAVPASRIYELDF
jgi:uncharacterized protein